MMDEMTEAQSWWYGGRLAGVGAEFNQHFSFATTQYFGGFILAPTN
jgi:hypothetical protein